MVILRLARPPASAPTSNESWLALAGFVSNQLSGGQFNKEKLPSQPARNTACKQRRRDPARLTYSPVVGPGLRSFCFASRLSIVTVLRQTGIYYAVSSPMWILVEMVKAVERIFTRYFFFFLPRNIFCSANLFLLNIIWNCVEFSNI